MNGAKRIRTILTAAIVVVVAVAATATLAAAVATSTTPVLAQEARQTDVFCDFNTLDNCRNNIDPTISTEFFDCQGTPQTDDVTCASEQTSEIFSCMFVSTVGDPKFIVADLYLCTEIEQEPPPPPPPLPPPSLPPPAQGQPADIATPITQEVEQESESGDVNLSFEVS